MAAGSHGGVAASSAGHETLIRRRSIPSVYGNVNGLKPNQLLRLAHLYRRRVPIDKVITPELARACTELSQEIRCQIGLVITRRGVIEQVIVGNGRELVLSDLGRLGRRLLRLT
ncbi:MAG: hypothetical protein E6K69_10280 [Nitrospirae bacterium]|nr:MAG: hypothetical protein E6K69_10280 [Nitrospirota bacterium]